MNLDRYSFTKALLDFEYGSQFYTEPSYKNEILLNEFDSIPDIHPDWNGELGYRYANDLKGIDVIVDPYHSYKLNSEGYRSKEFSTNSELVVAGCSNTYGMGVPITATWGSMVADSLGIQYDNLGINGASAYYVVKNTFAYFKKYGNPKMAFLLLPDFNRFYVPSDPNLLISKDMAIEDGKLQTASMFYHVSLTNYDGFEEYIDISSRPKYSKRPHYIQDVISQEMVYFYTCQMINVLEMYCESAGIKLLWSTWSKPTSDVFSNMKKENPNNFKYFIELDLKKDNCHEKLKSNYEYCFDLGTDAELGARHPGVHAHAHWAESYLSGLSTIYDTDII